MRKKLGLITVVVCASLCVTVPAASARTAHASAKAKAAYTHKTQDKYIKKLRSQVKSIGTALATLTGQGKSNTDTLGTIVAGVPNIVSALTQLKDGLTTLADAYKAVEYGVLHTVISVGGGNVADMPNQFSGDIPDDGNGAQVTGEIPFTAPASAPTAVNVRAAIRSVESDGKATGDPAGEVGGLVFVTCGSGGGCGGAPPGTVMCVPGQTPANFNYVNPSSGQTSVLALVPIQIATARTDQSRPTDDQTDTSTVNATAGSRCSWTAAAGATYVVHTTFQFFDLPTSATPGATD